MLKLVENLEDYTTYLFDASQVTRIPKWRVYRTTARETLKFNCDYNSLIIIHENRIGTNQHFIVRLAR